MAVKSFQAEYHLLDTKNLGMPYIMMELSSSSLIRL